MITTSVLLVTCGSKKTSTETIDNATSTETVSVSSATNFTETKKETPAKDSKPTASTEHVHHTEPHCYYAYVTNVPYDTEAEMKATEQNASNNIASTGCQYDIEYIDENYCVCYGNPPVTGKPYPFEPKYYLNMGIKVNEWWCEGCATLFTDEAGTTRVK